MSAHVLLNLLKELRKGDKMRYLPFYGFFATSFNKFNSTGARILDTVYLMTLKFLKIAFLAGKRQDFAIIYATLS